jgi:glycyl-tRNA synthetase beta chain
MTSASLAVELVTEELPPKALKTLGDAFATGLADALRGDGFLEDSSVVTPFATPRRLGVTITGVRRASPDKPFREKLLPVSVAFDAHGRPTPALVGKLKAKQLAHIDPRDLIRESDGKVESLFYADIAKGSALTAGLQAILDRVLDRLPIPKVMDYAAHASYYNNVRFVRPAHLLLALHGEEIVPIQVLGLDAGRVTSGHRFLARPDLPIASADAYAPTLEAEGKVIPSFASRRELIAKALERHAEGSSVVMPDALLDEVTALVEWPVVYAGEFDRAFLDVPQECLILTMQQNQRYFALEDREGRLKHRFLLVANLEPKDPAAIIHGNERVLRARLADAKFFFDQDRKTPLASRVERLRSIVYNAKFGAYGSQADRVDRLRFIARAIASRVGADPSLADRGALLAKADLTTDMVGEFPELQGTMGRYYALHDREPVRVADAIAEHYWPRFAGDALPESNVAQAVALADKLEALAGLFGVGQIPTGDKDPFGLRRAALGIIRILVERKLALSLRELVGLAFDAFANVPVVRDARAEVSEFIYERLRGYLREQGNSANQTAAVVDSGPDTIHDLPQRLIAVRTFEALPESSALATANKRIVNILRKSESEAAAAVDRSMLTDGAEHDLYAAFQKLHPQVEAACAGGDFTSALKSLAGAKPVVDRFFDDVMVMADDPAIRSNRLALLRGVAATMNRVADISKLAS